MKACGCTSGDLPSAWKREHLLLHDPALKGDRTPLATRASDDGGLTFDGWSKARLVPLPKKRGLSLAQNWRGICLLGTVSEILPNIMVKRMQALIEQVAFEMQAGFRPEHRMIDGVFVVMMGFGEAPREQPRFVRRVCGLGQSVRQGEHGGPVGRAGEVRHA